MQDSSDDTSEDVRGRRGSDSHRHDGRLAVGGPTGSSLPPRLSEPPRGALSSSRASGLVVDHSDVGVLSGGAVPTRIVTGNGGSDVRLQRRVLRLMALVVVVTLLSYLYDRAATSDDDDSFSGEPAEPMDGSEDLELALQQVQSEYAHYDFPGSVSEVFHGSWNRSTHAWSLPRESNITLRFLTLHNTKHKPTAATGLYFNEPTGRMELQLSTVSSPVAGLHVVRGRLHVADGQSPTDHDLVVTVDGLYVPAIGRLSLASTESDTVVGVGVEAPKEEPRSQLHHVSHGPRELLPRFFVAADDYSPYVPRSSALRGLMARLRLRRLSRPGNTGIGTGVSANPTVPIGDLTEGDDDTPATLELDRCGLRAELAFAPVSALEPGVSPFAVLQAPVVLGTEASSDSPPLVAHARSLYTARFVHASGLIYSDKCSFMFNTTFKALSYDNVQLRTQTVHLAVVSTLITLCQYIGVMYETMRLSGKPDLARRTAVATVFMQAMIDAYAGALFLFAALLWAPWFAAFAIVAFAKLLLVFGLQLRLAYVILRAHRPGDQPQDRGWRTTAREFGVMTLKFVCGVALGFVASYLFWDSLTILVFMGCSFWLPQIALTAYTRRLGGLSVGHAAVMTTALAFYPLYLWTCPRNFLQSLMPYPPSYFTATSLCLWLGGQVAIMIGQARYGPQFFLPASLKPPKYDYHRMLPSRVLDQDSDGTLAAGQGGSLGGADGGAGRTGSGQWDSRVPGDAAPSSATDTDALSSGEDQVTMSRYRCAICTRRVPDSPREYMITPCDHVFHRACLLRWMQVKMECPMCRRDLPVP